MTVQWLVWNILNADYRISKTVKIVYNTKGALTKICNVPKGRLHIWKGIYIRE